LTTPRFLLAVESLAPGNGGVCRVARLMARALHDTGWSAQAVVLSDRQPPTDLGVPARVLGGSRLAFARHVWQATPGTSHIIYDFAGMARVHCRIPLLRRPYLTFIHGIEVWKGWAQPKYLRAARGAGLLLSNSAYTRDRAEREFGGFARAEVCWLATEADAPPEDTPPVGPPRVLMVGRVEANGYKGHGEILQAWPHVHAAVPDAVLTVVGGGDGLAALRQQAAGIAKVEVLGFVPEVRMAEVWRSARVFALPSRGEGFGLVYIEAMRHGLPVIASVHDAAPEVNLDGQTGYNVDLDRPGELAERLICLLRDPDHAAALGHNGRRRWAEHFRYSAFRERFVGLVRRWVGA
jgi:phosphatidylinositol alpha-1,6-mannosyltransferase